MAQAAASTSLPPKKESSAKTKAEEDAAGHAAHGRWKRELCFFGEASPFTAPPPPPRPPCSFFVKIFVGRSVGR